MVVLALMIVPNFPDFATIALESWYTYKRPES